jgi:hypothetical protein
MKTEINISEYTEQQFKRWFHSKKDGDVVRINYQDNKKRDRALLASITRDEWTGRKTLNFLFVKYKYEKTWLENKFEPVFTQGKNYVPFTITS